MVCRLSNTEPLCEPMLTYCHLWCGADQIILTNEDPPTLQWRYNERDSVSNQQPRDCLLDGLFRRGSKKTSKLRVTGLCEGNSLVTGEFPAQWASKAENVSIWWRHHETIGMYATMRAHAVWLYCYIRISEVISCRCELCRLCDNNHHTRLTHWGGDKMAATLQTTFLELKLLYLFVISLKFVPGVPIHNK